jgi:hypothetical protein
MMHEIGETHTFASWPYYLEEAIQDWVDGDNIKRMAFTDRKGIVTTEFYSRLGELRRKVGGWLYWKDDESGVAFLPEVQWQRLREESKRTGSLAGRGNRFAARP